MSSVVTVENLTKKYGDLTAVSDVSFEVKEAECFGILGPNGAGKTLTIRIIQCLARYSHACIRLQGQIPSIFLAPDMWSA